jgi:hypothetical protein
MNYSVNHTQSEDPLALFEQTARRIYRLACKHGATYTLLFVDRKASRESFLKACHNGFAKAQELIVIELITIQETQKNLKDNLKSARRQRDRTAITKVEKEISIENFKEHILRKLADSIAWHIIRGQKHIAKRLYLRESNRPNLKSSNLSSVINVVNSYNKENSLNFALLSDITSFVQIGDVLLSSLNVTQIIEVKEGQKNLEAAAIVESFNNHSTHKQQIEELNLNDNLREQVQRMLRQQTRTNQATNLVNTGKGNDPATGLPVIISDVEFPEEEYYEELGNLLCQLSPNKNCAYTVIDDSLYIGVYKGILQSLGSNLLRRCAFEGIDERYPVTDLREGIAQALVEPLFVKPFTEDQIFDIAFGRVSVLMLLRVDRLLNLFEETNATARFLSPKQSRREQANHSKFQLLLHQECCVEIATESGMKQILGDGIETRIVYDTLTPRWVVRMAAHDRPLTP